VAPGAGCDSDVVLDEAETGQLIEGERIIANALTDSD
jgi:hypothetical protein